MQLQAGAVETGQVQRSEYQVSRGLEQVPSRFAIPGKSARTFIFPTGDRFVGHQIETQRWWEVQFTASLYEAARRGIEHAAFVDVGANFGTTSIMAADFFGKIYAFEMEENNCRIFEQAMAINAIHYELFRMAVSDEVAERKAYVFRHNPGAHSLAKMRDEHDLQEVTVRTTKLDNLDPAIRNVRFVHIDTEGHDIKVLQGSRAFIARQEVLPYIQIEFCPQALALHGSDVADLIAFMDAFGYEAYMNCVNVLSKLSRHMLAEMFFTWKKTPAMLDINLIPVGG